MRQKLQTTSISGKSRLVGAVLAVALVALFHPVSVQACAACFGKSDAPMARGMNWGIMSLLGVVGMVLGILSAFFVFLAKKANSVPLPVAPPAMATQPTELKHELG